jgi:hypothetical protein
MWSLQSENVSEFLQKIDTDVSFSGNDGKSRYTSNISNSKLKIITENNSALGKPPRTHYRSCGKVTNCKPMQFVSLKNISLFLKRYLAFCYYETL